jgi:basic membrane lipoprotein Med (substrate-binding protein (PBP1-ABC) superfamily)
MDSHGVRHMCLNGFLSGFVALLSAAVIVLLSCAPLTATARFTAPLGMSNQTVRLCFLYFGAITDLGWTYSYNAGRLMVHDALTTRYPNATFHSTYTENVFGMSSEAKHTTIMRYVSSGCDVILSNSATLMNGADDVFAAAYPNVSFVLLDEYRMEDTTYPNRVYVANDYTGGYYAAGVGAGKQATTCIGFLAAWSTELDPTNAWAGFLLGVRSVNSTIPVHVVPQESWGDAVSDAILVRAFTHQLGCQIIGRYSDPFTADVDVSTLPNRTDIFTIGAHSDLERYVGDSVFTSVYIDWSVSLLNVLLPLFDTGALNQSVVHFYGLSEKSVLVAEVSPQAAPEVAAAVTDAVTYVAQRHERVVCGVVPLQHGGYVLRNTTPITVCKVAYHNIGDLITDPYVVHHRPFTSPFTCPAGTRYVYDALVTRSIQCVPCGVDTYASQAGASECLVCPSGTHADGGASACVSKAALSPGAAVGIALCGFVFALLLSALYMRIRAVRSVNEHAPRDAPVSLVFVSIEAGGPIAKLCGVDMDVAKSTFLTVVRSIIQRNAVYEAVCTNCIVIACPSAFDAVGVAVEVQEAIAMATWPPMIRDLGGLKPRIAVQLCNDVQISYDPRTWRYAYDGVDVEVGRALADLAPSGAILADQSTMDAVMAEDDFSLVLAYEVVVRLWRSANVASPYTERSQDLQLLLGSISDDPTSTAALRHRLESTNIFSLDSKQLPNAATTNGGIVLPTRHPVVQNKRTSGEGGVAPLEGLDPELEQSAHSSFSTTSSLTFGRQDFDMGPPQIALALYALFNAAERTAPAMRRPLLTLLSEIFSLESGRHLSSRRVAAALAFRVLQRVKGKPSGHTTTESVGAEDATLPTRAATSASGSPAKEAISSLTPPPVPTMHAVKVLAASHDHRLPVITSNPLTSPPPVTRVPPPPPLHQFANPHLQGGSDGSSEMSWHAANGQHDHTRPIVLPGGVVFHPNDSSSAVSMSQPSREIEMLRCPSERSPRGTSNPPLQPHAS